MIHQLQAWWKDHVRKNFLRLPKQLRYLLSSFIGAAALFAGVAVPSPFHWILVPFFGLLAYFLCWFALIEDLHKDEWYVLFILPVTWFVLWYLSYYILPSRLFTRLAFTAIFPLIFYLILSTMNIFNVGVEKGIQLYRAAQTANQLLMIVIYYLFTLLVSAFDVHWFFLGVSVGVFSFVLSTQLFWSLDPQEIMPKSVWQVSILAGILMGYTMILLSFLPFSLDTPRPMIITGVFYVFSGLFAMYTDEVAFRYRSREYLVIFVILFAAFLLTLRW